MGTKQGEIVLPDYRIADRFADFFKRVGEIILRGAVKILILFVMLATLIVSHGKDEAETGEE
ncbi:MAG: hypothetical protein PHD51_00945 [Patescibacteria group bacterium]|nr:hypothetical protein [Patescibacteria group bacterium]MDD5490570.1 hypothetical protein [Patescibacteria group bacterium]